MRLTRINTETGAVVEYECPKLRDVGKAVFWTLYDNLGESRSIANNRASKSEACLAEGMTRQHGPYRFELTP